MRYPQWFPYPGCWWRAVITWMTANLIALTFVVTVPLAIGLGGLLFAIAAEAPGVLSLALGLVGAIVLSIPLVLFPVFIYAHVRQLGAKLVGERDSLPFIPTVDNWRKGLGDVTVVSTGALFGLLFLIGANHLLNDTPYPTSPTDEEIAIAGVVALIVTAYCYHFRVLFHRHQEHSRRRSNLNRNRQTLRKNKGHVPKTIIVDDPIELELMELRKKMRND